MILFAIKIELYQTALPISKQTFGLCCSSRSHKKLSVSMLIIGIFLSMQYFLNTGRFIR